MCEICPKLTRQTPNQMSETKFWQMFSFSIILTSLHSLNLSFPFLLYVISTAIFKFPPRFPASPPLFPTFFAFLLTFPQFPRWLPTPTFTSYSLYFYPYSPHFRHSVPKFSILAITDTQLSLYSLTIYFTEMIVLVQKRTLPFVTTAQNSAANYCLHHQWRYQCYHQKLFTL